MSSLNRKLRQALYYANLVNPLVARKHRVCSSFGPGVPRRYEFLEESQWWPEERLREYRDGKLGRLLAHAYAHVPYYREAFEERGITPADIARAEDLSKLPILTKEIIRKRFPDGILDVRAGAAKGKIWTTGGSTGEPLEFVADDTASDFAWGAFFRCYRWHGYEWGDRVAIFFRPFSLTDTRPWLDRHLERLKTAVAPNVKYYDGSRLSDGDLARVVDDLLSTKTRILRGYPSAVTRLARYCRDHGVPWRPRFVTATGEVLFDWQREELTRQFECNVVDQYGCAEVMGVAFECERHDGLHITVEHCIVEIVDENGNAVGPGQKGVILLTDLDNRRMPFIRYLVGDEGTAKSDRCQCGRNLPRLGPVEGRTCDFVRGMNGRVAHGLFFVTLFQEFQWFERLGVTDFEIVQRREDSIDVRLVCRQGPDRSEQERFAALCRQMFGETRIKVECMPDIPRNAAGKRRYTRYET